MFADSFVRGKSELNSFSGIGTEIEKGAQNTVHTNFNTKCKGYTGQGPKIIVVCGGQNVAGN